MGDVIFSLHSGHDGFSPFAVFFCPTLTHQPRSQLAQPQRFTSVRWTWAQFFPSLSLKILGHVEQHHIQIQDLKMSEWYQRCHVMRRRLQLQWREINLSPMEQSTTSLFSAVRNSAMYTMYDDARHCINHQNCIALRCYVCYVQCQWLSALVNPADISGLEGHKHRQSMEPSVQDLSLSYCRACLKCQPTLCASFNLFWRVTKPNPLRSSFFFGTDLPFKLRPESALARPLPDTLRRPPRTDPKHVRMHLLRKLIS